MVLEHVNRIREEAGLPPAERIEVGMRDRSDECALARTIGAGAEVHEDHIAVGGRFYRHPRPLRRWLKRYDRGKMRELTTNRPRRVEIEPLDFEEPSPVEETPEPLAPPAL